MGSRDGVRGRLRDGVRGRMGSGVHTWMSFRSPGLTGFSEGFSFMSAAHSAALVTS